MYQKKKIIRDPAWLKRVHLLPCVLTGYEWYEGGPLSVDPAHIRDGLEGGTSMKPGDDLVLPLRHDLHVQQSNMPEVSFWCRHYHSSPLLVRRCRMALGEPVDTDSIMDGLKAYARYLYSRYKSNTLDLPF